MSPQSIPDPKEDLKRLPLVQQYSSRDGSIVKDARLVNAYAEKQPNGKYTVRKRPCVAGIFSMPTGQAQGFFFGNGWLYIVILTGPGVNTLFAINLVSTTVYNLGAIDATGSQYKFENIAEGPAFATVFIGNGKKQYALGGGSIPPTVLLITDVNFPTNFVAGTATLDGTTYVMDIKGQIFGSNINDPTTWSALNVIQANSDPDPPVGLAKYLTYVIAFKQWTTNIFYDAANQPPGSPLAPVTGALIPYGCLANTTIQELDGQLFWVTSGKNVTPQIGSINNLQFSIISTPQVDRLLLSGGSANEFYSWTLKTGGHKFYGLTNYIQNYTMVYDLDQQLWQIWTDATGTLVFPTVLTTSQTLTAYQQAQLGLGLFNGIIYSIQPDYLLAVDTIDAAGHTTAPIVDIYTPSFDGNTRRRKVMHEMFFTGDKSAGSILQARFNDSDYQSDKWSNFRLVDMSAIRPTLDNNGTFSRRAYNFRHQCPTPFRIDSVDLQLELGI